MITVNPAKSNALIKQKAKVDIEAERDAKLAAGVQWNGHVWQTNAAFQTHITGLMSAFTAGILPADATVIVRTQDNQNVPLTQDELKAMAGTVLQYIQTVFAESWAEKDAL